VPELAAPVLLRDHTTMRVGGPALRFEVATDVTTLIELIAEADGRGERALVMGGGSNLVIGDEGFHGLVVQVATSELTIDSSTVRADAGVDWDTVVAASIDAGLAGLEALSGIPGSVGGTPIQNVGAYGALTSDVLSALTVYDRMSRTVRQWGPAECGFGPHRQSIFKRGSRYVVLDVTYELRRSPASAPVSYQRLADRLGVELGAQVAAPDVRAAVLALRGASGMLLDPADHDTWSVGSFFLNPVVASVPEAASGCPSYPDADGVKLPAAWLINHAGFDRGYGAEFGNGRVALSAKHALAITNRGGAATADVMAFAGHIRAGVETKFGIRLEPECDLVNCQIG
jgi:UDP-N-acetylmuramate dehydrogenase